MNIKRILYFLMVGVLLGLFFITPKNEKARDHVSYAAGTEKSNGSYFTRKKYFEIVKFLSNNEFQFETGSTNNLLYQNANQPSTSTNVHLLGYPDSDEWGVRCSYRVAPPSLEKLYQNDYCETVCNILMPSWYENNGRDYLKSFIRSYIQYGQTEFKQTFDTVFIEYELIERSGMFFFNLSFSPAINFFTDQK